MFVKLENVDPPRKKLQSVSSIIVFSKTLL